MAVSWSRPVSQVAEHGQQSPELSRLSRLFLRAALPHNRRLRMAGHLMRIYQRSGIQALVRKSGLLRWLPGGLANLESQMPVMGSRFFGPRSSAFPSQGTRRMTVGLLSGCVMPLMQGDTMRAAVRVLQRNGCDVIVPSAQGCCGALNLHAGDLELGRLLARRNIDAFREAGVDVVITASAGCGSSMKEYGDLLRDDPDYAQASADFAAHTRDITEFLAALPLDPPRTQYACHVTMQDPCHLAHAQRITAAPRQGAAEHPRPNAHRNGGVFAVLRLRWVLFPDPTRDVGPPAATQGEQRPRHRSRNNRFGKSRLRVPVGTGFAERRIHGTRGTRGAGAGRRLPGRRPVATPAGWPAVAPVIRRFWDSALAVPLTVRRLWPPPWNAAQRQRWRRKLLRNPRRKG